MAPSGGWRNGWRAQMFQNPPSYKHLPVFFVAVPLVWVDWDVPGGNPELSEVKWSDVWPSMVTHTRNCALHLTHPSAHTQQWTHTHCEHTPRVVGSHIAAAPGEQLGVRCLAQGSHLSRGIEGGESAGYSLPPPTIPARPETRTRDLRVASPTLSIRPRLPKDGSKMSWQPPMISPLDHSPPSPPGIATGPHDTWNPGSPSPDRPELHQSQVVEGVPSPQ